MRERQRLLPLQIRNLESGILPPRTRTTLLLPFWSTRRNLAAALVLTLGLGFISGLLVSAIDELAPTTAAIADLFPADRVMRGAESTPQVVMASAPLVLILHVGEALLHNTYTVSLRNQTGDEIWRNRSIQPDLQNEAFILNLPREFLEPGTYLVDIHENHGARLSVLASYTFEVAE